MTVLFLVSLLVIFILLPGNALHASLVDDWKSLLEPINPDFTAYMKSLKQDQKVSGSEFFNQLGYIPPPLKLSHVKGVIDEAVNTTYPAYYDLRTLGRVSPMKDQGRYFSCWAFASYASLESCLLPQEIVDFSEWHLNIEHGFDYGLYEGGNAIVTGAYLLRWSGPVFESIVPYPYSSKLSSVMRDFPVAKHVQQVISLPERTGPLDNNTIKYFVTNYGPVDFAMCFWEGANWDNFTYYDPKTQPQNHRLAICGWDDNFPASKFNTPPPGNGAFIVKNSWGIGFGERGYWYISYYEMSIQELTSYNKTESVENYDYIYQYDMLGRSTTWGERDSFGANVFTAISAHPLEAVGFFVNDSNVYYEISVYKNLSPTPTAPIDGVLAAYKSGTLIYPGFFTIPLDTLVPLQPGEKFSVVVSWHNPAYPRAVSIEMPIPKHNSKSVANPGESYISLDGSNWRDLTELFPNSNVCIKAYTQFPRLDVQLSVHRQVYNSWLISRVGAIISFSVPDLNKSAASFIKIYRSENGGPYNEIRSIPVSQITNNQYSFSDRYLDTVLKYAYRVVVYNETQLVLGKSIDIII